MPADHLAVGSAQFLEAGVVFLDVPEKPVHAADVLGPGARFGENGENVLQRLPRLAGEVAGFEFLLRVPADLARDEDQPPLGDDAVGIAFGLGPARKLKDFHWESVGPEWLE